MADAVRDDPGWLEVDKALIRCIATRGPLPVWWRDDDAVTLTPALDRLGALSAAVRVPVHLAVIPSRAEPALAGLDDRFIPVVHGWAHKNHEPRGIKKAEFGASRADAAIRADLSGGLSALGFVGSGVARMFVPPWNRISRAAVAALPLAGFKCLSTFTPRPARLAAPGLLQVNAHVDPIDWHGTRSAIPTGQLCAGIVRLLDDRTSGATDAREPLGLLTHHLVHDEAIWNFVATFWDVVRQYPTGAWSIRNIGEIT